jgi:hypothetical protein
VNKEASILWTGAQVPKAGREVKFLKRLIIAAIYAEWRALSKGSSSGPPQLRVLAWRQSQKGATSAGLDRMLQHLPGQGQRPEAFPPVPARIETVSLRYPAAKLLIRLVFQVEATGEMQLRHTRVEPMMSRRGNDSGRQQGTSSE